MAVIIGLVTMLVLGASVMCTAIIRKGHKLNEPLVIESLETTYSGSTHVPKGTAIMSEEEWSSTMGTTSYSTYEDYVAANESSFQSSVPTITADGINAEIFQYCDDYFKVYYGAERVSPLFPMALSNNETQGRADFDVSWCALLPTRYVDVSRIGTFDVTDVVSDDSTYRALSADYSTRDRGCLQMSPTYGTNNAYLNSLMSGTEKEKLAKIDTSKYSTWVSGASSQPGDRFYLPDVLMRLQAAMEASVATFINNDYVPSTDMQMIAMLAIDHNSGNVFYFKDHNRKIGNWISGQKAYDYCAKVGAIEMVQKVEELANTSNMMYISPSVAHKLYEEVYNESYTGYCSSNVNSAYPIMVMYSYMKLVQLYTS